MSLKISGPRVFASPTGAYSGTPTTATISCRVKIDPASATPTQGAILFGRSNGQGFSIHTYTSWIKPSIRFQMFAAIGGVSVTYEFNYVPGRAYHLAATWDATNLTQSIYLDGRLVASGASSTFMQGAGSASFQVGSASQAAGAISYVDDCYFWSGVAATASDVVALRDRTVLPTNYRPSNLVWGVSLDGIDGATATAGDPGLVDAAAGRNLVPSGSGTATWSSDSLPYKPQLTTTAKVLRSGKTMAFFFADSVSGGPTYPSINGSNPTISINGGAPVTLTSPVMGISGYDLPFFQYALPSTLSPSDVVTFSAPDGWASIPTPQYSAAPVQYAGPASNVAVVNGVGLPNFTAPTPSMKLGLNLTPPSYWTQARIPRNLIKQCNYWGNVSAFDANGKPTSNSGTWFAWLPPLNNSDGIDSLNQPGTDVVPWMPYNNNRYTMVWSEASPSNDSALKLTNGTGASSDASVTITERTDLAVNPPDGQGRTKVFEVTRPQGATNYSLGLQVRGSRLDWTDLQLYGPGNRVDPTKVTDEVLAAYSRGASIIRSMAPLPINGSCVATRDHLKPATDFTYGYSRPYWVNLAQVDPVASVSDYAFYTGWMAASFTTTTPHGLYTGQTLTFQGVANKTFSFAVTLGPAITATATTLTLASTAGIKAPDFVVIDSEWMQVSTVASDGVTLTVTRGVAGTAAAAHAAGAGGTCYPQAIYAYDGVTRVNMASNSASIYVTSPTTFECMFTTGTSLGTNTANAYPTTQTLMPIGQVGTPNLTPGIPYQHVYQMCSEMGVDCWINVPFAATDDCVRAIAEMARDYLTPGLKVWVEFSNEMWNTAPGFRGQAMGAVFMGNKSSPKLTAPQYAAKRSGEVHAIFQDVLAAAGRPDALVRVFGSWFVSSNWTQQIVNYCAANGIPLDAVCVSPYIDMQSGWAAATNSYDSEMLHDFWQLYLTHGSPWNTARPSGYNAQQKAAITSAFPNGKLVSYEGSLQAVLPTNATNYVTRSHDFRYHPRMYDTMMAYFASLQNGGQDTFCFFQVEDGGAWRSMNGAWAMYFWHGQPWGYGDGSDGKANNLDCLAATKPATVQQDYQNVSVMGQAFKDWTAALPHQSAMIEPLSSSGGIGNSGASSDASITASSLEGGTAMPLQGGGTLSGVVSYVSAVVSSGSTLPASGSLGSPRLVNDSSLNIPSTNALGGLSQGYAVTVLSANPSSLRYFAKSEPTSRIAGSSITVNLDFFGRSEPFGSASQVVTVNTVASPAAIGILAGLSSVATLNDQWLASTSIASGGGVAAATASIDAAPGAIGLAAIGGIAPGSLASIPDQGIAVAPIAGLAGVGLAAANIGSTFLASTVNASGSLGSATAAAARAMNPNDLRYFKRAEPLSRVAGKNPTAGLDTFRRGEPFAAVISTASTPPSSQNATATSASLSSSGVSAVASIVTNAALSCPPQSAAGAIAPVTTSLDSLVQVAILQSAGGIGTVAIGSLASVSATAFPASGVLATPAASGSTLVLGTANSATASLGSATLLYGSIASASGLAAAGVSPAAGVASGSTLAGTPLQATGGQGTSATLLGSSIGSASLSGSGNLGASSGLVAFSFATAALGASGAMGAPAESTGVSKAASPLIGAGLLGTPSNLGSVAMNASNLNGAGTLGSPALATVSLLSSAPLGGAGTILAATQSGSASITATVFNGTGALGSSGAAAATSNAAAAIGGGGTLGSPTIVGIATAVVAASSLVTSGTLSTASPNGSHLMNVAPNAGDGTLEAATISASSIANVPVFPMAANVVPPSLMTDMRLQAAGLGEPGAMGNSSFAGEAIQEILALTALGTIGGGRVPSHRGAKRYLPPRRFRCR